MFLKPPPGTPLITSHPRLFRLTKFWPMNEGAGGHLWDVRRRSDRYNGNFVGCDHDILFAAPTASPSWNQSPWGPAVSFDGVNDYASENHPESVSATINLNGTHSTLVASFYPTANGTTAGIMYNEAQVCTEAGGYYGFAWFQSAGQNKVAAWIYDGAVKSVSANINQLNRWYSLAFRTDNTAAPNTVFEFFLDGVSQGTTTFTTFGTGAPSFLYLGRNYSGASFFPGRVGYVAGYTQQLPTFQIKQWHQDPFAEIFEKRNQKRLAYQAVAAPITDLRWAPRYPDRVSHPGIYPAQQRAYFHGNYYPGGTIRNTQHAVEDLEQSTNIHSRLTQIAVEDFEQRNSAGIHARLTQVAVEFLIPFSCATNPPVAGCPAEEPPAPVTPPPGCEIDFSSGPV